jgi:hypothetical protein
MGWTWGQKLGHTAKLGNKPCLHSRGYCFDPNMEIGQKGSIDDF